MRRVLAVVVMFLVLLAGYVTLDIFDVVPGVLTRSAPPAPPATATTRVTAAPTVPIPTIDAGAEPLPAVSAGAPIPAGARLQSVLGPTLSDPALGPHPGFVVRDAFTGQDLVVVDADRPRVAASTAKLLTALAVVSTLDPQSTMSTTVVQGATPSEIVLVAGGDTMLAPGAGRPTAVEGHAGLADLASQVATALRSSGLTTVKLRLDTTYDAGPRWAPGWPEADIAAGYTGGVSMLGLAGQRATPGKPAPRDPEAAVAAAFVANLKSLGITAALEPESTWSTPTVAGETVLGTVQSAPVSDVLALALDDSDNALTEGLARQATVKAGGAPTFPAAVAFVKQKVAALGVDLTGVTLKDTSGLTAGQAIPPRVLADVLQLGTDGTVAAMQDIVAKLPVAGLSGTLHDRFTARATHAVAGIARAKTGTLTGASAMAGTVVDADGRVLSYVAVADGLRPGVGTLQARAALDRFVAALATCGCR